MNLKKTIALLTSLSLFFVQLSVLADETEQAETLQEDVVLQNVIERKIKHVYENFERYTGGSSNLSVYFQANGAEAIKGDSELLDGTSMCMNFENVNFQNTTKAEPFLYYTYPTSEKFSWKVDVCFDGKVASGGFVVVAKNSTGGNVYLQNVNFSSGDLVINNYRNEANRIEFLPNTRYSLEYSIDVGTKTFDFYVNDELVADDYRLQADFASINQLRFITAGDAVNHENVYIDNFTIYKYTQEENISPEISWEVADEIDLNAVSQIAVDATDTDGDIEKVELYCDNTLIGETALANALFDISDIEKGEHTLKAIAYDNEGAFSEIEKFVNFVRNEIELISVSTNLENDSYDISELDKIVVFAEGNTAEIEKVILYIDGTETVRGTSMEISSDYIPTGEHEIKIVVFDGDMNKGTWRKNVSFTENADDVWYENDFSAYSGGNAVTGLVFNTSTGLSYACTSEVIDEEYGQSIYFDIDEEKVTTETVDVGVWYTANTDKRFKWNVSMYFDAIPENVHFQTVGPNSSGSNVYLSNILIKNGMVTSGGSTVASIETGKFYDFSYIIDIPNKKYSFSIDGVELVSNADFSGDIKSISTLRLVTNYKKDTQTGFALDNVSVSGNISMPNVVSISQIDEKTISFEMTDASNVELSDVTVCDESGEIVIDNLVCEGNAVNVVLKNPLNNDSKYHVYIIPKIDKDGTWQYGRATSGVVTTERGEYGVSDVNFRFENNELVSEIMIYNNTADIKNALLVMNVYKNNKIIDSNVKSVAVDTDAEEIFELKSEMYDNSSVAKVFVLNSWQDRSAFGNLLFKY